MDELRLAVPGLTYLPDYLSPAEHDRLLALVDSRPWRDDLRRRVQHYGYRYDYKARKVDPSMYLGPLPDWADQLARRLHSEGWFPAPADQLIVNEYEPGQGISKHVDCVPCFDHTIASISLGSACVMEMSNGKMTVPLLLEPRSAVILKDEARYRWTHAVPARKSDRHGGRTIPRGRRVSLTFRKVLVDRGSGEGGG